MPNRTCVLHAQFGAVTDDAHTTTCSYSVHRGNRTGVPDDDPAIFTEWDQVASKTTFYISWNSATEAESWEIHSVANNEKREATAAADSMLGTVVKKGFETVLDQPVRGGTCSCAGKGREWVRTDGSGRPALCAEGPLCLAKKLLEVRRCAMHHKIIAVVTWQSYL